MGKAIKICVALIMIGSASITLAADAKNLSSSCVSCHGASGISSNPLYPNLAGQKSAYLLKQMRDFKTGQRKDPIMNAMVQALSEPDLEALADYYSKK